MIAKPFRNEESEDRSLHRDHLHLLPGAAPRTGADLTGSVSHNPRVAGRPANGALDLAQTSLDHCQRLGMVPVQFIRWNPDLLAAAINRGPSRRLQVFKRCVDLLFSVSLGIAVVLLLPFVALAIKLDSPGPVFYSQTRLGKDGRRFRIHKFRSMLTNAEADGAKFATENDARVTRLGKFMRRTRIDELPQLWCVIKGDMSVIGPRPERPEHMAHIEAVLPEFAMRLAVKPGLTGWAQTSYRYAGTLDELRTKLEYDLYYIQFASIWMEILILLRTVKVVFRFKGQ